MLRGKNRTEGAEMDLSAQQQLKEHQKQLHEQRQERGLERFAEGGDGKGGEEKKVWKRYESYKKEDQLPKQVANFRVSCAPYLLPTLTVADHDGLSLADLC